MRTCRFYKYLMAMIIALGTTANIFAQQKNLKIYFKTAAEQDVANNSTPDFQFGGDVPAPALGLQVKKLEGVRWANGYRWFSGWHGKPTDRLIAAYVDENTKMDSKLKMEFENFPFEVNAIQWNAMNDLLSGAIFDITEWDTDIFDNYTVNYKYTPKTGNDITGSEQHWDLNIFTKRANFNQGDMPGASNMAMKGLTSFEYGEENYFKIGFLWWSIYSQKTALNDNCRTFIKAGWEEGMGSLPADGWAFNIKYSLPTLALRFADGRTNDSFIVDENNGNGVSLQAYISAHAGAIEPGKVLTNNNNNKFYYEYVSRNTEALTIDRWTGLAYPKKVGDVNVTVYLKFGQQKEDDVTICSYTKTLHINKSFVNENSPEICIGFVDGKKGYDVTVGDQNAQIQGFITANTPTDYSTGGYQFEYYESSNGEIITIDPATGKITPKKEGDVNITAVLKQGSRIVSNPYTYTLHVFAQHEGLEFRRINTYHYSNSSNQYIDHYIFGIPSYEDRTTWNVGTTSSDQNYDWKSNNLLRINTSINGAGNTYGVDDWKQIASFSTGEFSYWRAICQEIAFDVYVPKYTKSITQYSFAGNAAIGNKKTHSTGWNNTSSGDCKYGFEINYLNQKWVNGNPVNEQISLEEANTKLQNRNWNTNAAFVTETFARSGASSYTSNVGAANAIIREIDNVTSPKCNENRKLTVYFAVMAYLWNNESYPGNVSIGFKGIPTYTYHAKVTYAKNDGTDAIVCTESEWKTSTSKIGTFKLFQDATNSEKAQLSSRAGYTFLGWSTDPNATTPEYELEDDFPIYDSENGGGMGPVTLYAVWKPNKYIVELRHVADGRIDDYVEATYDQAMPSVNVNGTPIVVPVHRGYDFKGYYAEGMGSGTKYYNEDLSSNHIWDRTEKNYVVASWAAHKSTVVFDPQGGNNYGATRVTATYDAAMPTEGVQAPQRQGYTFGGYYSEANGQGTQYYTANMTSARTWNIDERLLNPQVTEVTLYAKWIGNTYAVTFDKQGGTGGSTSTTATYGQPLPSGLTAPTKEGYEFKGYYSSQNQEYAESIGQDYDGKQYYDKDMNGVESWDQTQAGTIYAHWAPKKFVVSFDGTSGAIVPKQLQYDSQKPISDVIYNSDGVVKISFKYGGQCPSQITNGKFKKAGFKLVGFYDSNNVLVASVKVDDPTDRNIYFNESSGYWTRKDGNFVWNCAHDVNLTARYEPKYTVRDGDIIDFGSEYLEVGIDWENSMVHDLLGAAEAEKEAGRISSTNPVMVFDIRNAKYLDNSSKKSDDLMVPLRDKDFISPNLLVYLGEGAYDVIENEIKTDGTCPGLVVTDRFPIKIPYAFNASKASYARDAQVNDAATEQASKSTWGTLCLPYPIKNNNTYKDVSKVIFYELRKHSGNVMQFYKLPEDAEIPANTPVLYERTVGISSAVTIEENAKEINGKKEWISVPDNPNFTAKVKSYANAPEPSIRDWEFRGNLKTTVFCGKGYVNPPAGAQILDGDVYYFKQNKFTYLNPKMEKNGKTYQAAKMTLYPYRAYFYRNTGGSYYSSAKVSEYSILVIGEDGATLDITNEIFGDGEGDGKIYDLNGIRVMKPVKGRLYIVNGQKKVYK